MGYAGSPPHEAPVLRANHADALQYQPCQSVCEDAILSAAAHGVAMQMLISAL